MKINKIFLFATLASAMLFTACSDDDDYSGPGEWNATADYANIYFKTTRVDESLDPADPTTATFNVYRRVQHEYTYGKDSLGNDTVSSDKIVTPLPARTIKLDIIENTDDVFKISDATFAEGDTVATVNVTFDGAEIGKTHTLKVTSNDPTLVSYYSKDITFTYNVTRVKWNLLGKGKIVSGYYFPGEAEVEIYQMDSNKNNYRVAHPFDDILAVLKADTENWAAGEFNGQQPEFLNITVLNDGLVTFESFNSGCYSLNYGADIWVHHPSWASSTSARSNWSHNCVLSLQADGKTPGQIQLAPWYYMDGVGGWNKTQVDGMIIITFPGFTPEYVASLENGDFDWEKLFTGVTISEKLGTTIEGATLYKGVEKADLAAAEEGCYERSFEELGRPYYIANAYAEDTELLFFVTNDGKVVTTKDYELQSTGLEAMGDEVYAKINGGKSTFSESVVVLNITFTNESGSIEYGTTNETFFNPTYKNLGTGTYTYGVEALSQDAGSYYEGTQTATLYECEQLPGNYTLKPWAASEDGLNFTIGADGKIRFYQFTGEAYKTYGDVYFIDLEAYNPGYTQYLGEYDEETKTYEFCGVYYIPAAGGGFGLVSETFVINEEAGARLQAPAKRNTLPLMFKQYQAPSRFVAQPVSKAERYIKVQDKLEIAF